MAVTAEKRLAAMLRREKAPIARRVLAAARASGMTQRGRPEPGELPAERQAERFVEDFAAAFEAGSWEPFYERYGQPAEGLLSAEEGGRLLTSRARLLVEAVLPLLLAAEPPVEPLVVAFSEQVYGLTQSVLDRYHRRLRRESARLDELKSTFMRLTTHELRAPLGTIRGYASMIENGDLGEPAPGIRQGAGRIIDSAETVLKLAADLGEVARLDEGAAILRLEDYPLPRLLREAVEGVRHETERRHVEIRQRSEQIAARVDPERARVAVSNLLSNAVKHSAAGTAVELEGAAEAGRVIVTVRDTGPGISPDELPLVFDKYFRSASSRRAGVPGTGLGLYIVKRLAELHQGDVSLESTEGKGVTARLVLPAAEP